MSSLTPREIVDELDRFIIGQKDAKRAVAIALRNRWRRMQLEPEMRDEVTPKNILMIGPTGVGKTEIARRLAALANAPFTKVEATRFTEVGYVGKDVEQIVRDLADVSVKMFREQAKSRVRAQAEERAEERILDALLPRRQANMGFALDAGSGELQGGDSETRSKFRKQLRRGELDEREIELEINLNVGVDIMAPPGMEEMANQLQGLFSSMGGRPSRRKLKVRDAMKLLVNDEAAKMINDEEIKLKAIDNVEQNGIVFIDEMDKVTRREGSLGAGADVSREGVQRDLLPLVEGCTVSTRYGMVRTDHILFIASGAFHLSKPSDLIPELQGRLPIRVELDALRADDFERILTEPDHSLTVQYQALLATEGVKLTFAPDGVRRIAEIADQVNERSENIGARRLHTVLERLLDTISFEAADRAGAEIVIDARYVEDALGELAADEDLSRYIL